MAGWFHSSTSHSRRPSVCPRRWSSERAGEALAAVLGAHVEVLEPDAGCAQEGREGPEPQRVAGQPAVRRPRPRCRETTASGPKRRGAGRPPSMRHLVGQVLVLGQLADHRHELGHVRLDRRADHPVRARLAAETTALSDASRMDESRPTPHHVVPSAPGTLDVGHGRGTRALGQRVLGVVLHLEHDTEVGLQRGDQRIDRVRCPRRVTVRCWPSTSSWAVTVVWPLPVDTSLVIRRRPASSGR